MPRHPRKIRAPGCGRQQRDKRNPSTLGHVTKSQPMPNQQLQPHPPNTPFMKIKQTALLLGLATFGLVSFAQDNNPVPTNSPPAAPEPAKAAPAAPDPAQTAPAAPPPAAPDP